MGTMVNRLTWAEIIIRTMIVLMIVHQKFSLYHHSSKEVSCHVYVKISIKLQTPWTTAPPHHVQIWHTPGLNYYSTSPSVYKHTPETHCHMYMYIIA